LIISQTTGCCYDDDYNDGVNDNEHGVMVIVWLQQP